MIWQTTFKHYCELRLAQHGFCSSLHGQKTTHEANWASSQHTPGRKRITEIICDMLKRRVTTGGRSGRPSNP